MAGETFLIRVSGEMLETWFTRDAEGNRLSVEIGEPDEDGIYAPVIETHYDDNLLAQR